MTTFDDFLRLDAQDFSRTRLLLFYGVSGSGKTTAIQHLKQRIDGLMVLDEIVARRDIRKLGSLLREYRQVAAATHVCPIRFWTLRLRYRTRVFCTDRDPAKLGRLLDRRSVSYSPASLWTFTRRYGANYTDLDIILERYPDVGFDEALARFEQFCEIERS